MANADVDAFLAHHGVPVANADVDAFLAHHGVPGMKWGRHKAQQIGTGTVGVAKRIGGAYANRAQASIDKSGGSKAKAITKAVGKDFVTSLGLAVGQKVLDQSLAAIMGDRASQFVVRRGVAKVGQMLQIANHAQGAAKIAAIATRPKTTKE
jgi:hypothetical protein